MTANTNKQNTSKTYLAEVIAKSLGFQQYTETVFDQRSLTEFARAYIKSEETRIIDANDESASKTNDKFHDLLFPLLNDFDELLPTETVDQTKDTAIKINSILKHKTGKQIAFKDADDLKSFVSAIKNTAMETDNSSPKDLFSDKDTTEIVIWLTNRPYTYDDQLCQFEGASSKVSSSAELLIPDENLLHALSVCGLSWTEYKEAVLDGVSEEQKAAYDSLCRHINPEMIAGYEAQKNPKKIFSAEDFLTVINEMTTYQFSFCLYLRAPLSDILSLDLDKPYTVTNACLAGYDKENGSFWYSDPSKTPITITKKTGWIDAPECNTYAPESICSLSHRYHLGSLKN